MSSPAPAATRTQHVGVALNILGTLVVIAACFLPLFYTYSINFDPVPVTVNGQYTGSVSLDILFLMLTLFFEGILALAWASVLIRRRNIAAIRPLAAFITIVGSLLTILLFLSIGSQARDTLLEVGIWTLLAGYALALAGVILLLGTGGVRVGVAAALLTAALIGGVAAGVTAAAPPNFLSCVHAAAAPSGKVIFGDNSLRLKAVNASNGRTAWSCTYFNYAVTPLSANSTMVIGVGGTHLFALRATDGALLWQRQITLCQEETIFRVRAAAMTSATFLLSASCQANYGGRDEDFSASALALRLTDGALLWHYSLDPTALTTILGTPAGLVLLESSRHATVQNQQSTYNDSITALNVASGSVAWQASAVGLASNATMVIALQHDGTLMALSATSGQILWQSSVNVPPTSSPVTLYARNEALLSGDTYYLNGNAANSNTVFAAVRISDGSVRWTLPMPQGTNATIVAVPTDISNVSLAVLLESPGAMAILEVLRTSDGTIVWHQPADPTNQYIEAGTTIYALQGNILVALNEMDGTRRWQSAIAFRSDHLVGADGTALYVLSQANPTTNANPQLVAIRETDGTLLWQSDDLVDVLPLPADVTGMA